MRFNKLLLTVLAISLPVLAGDVYRWVDEDGEVHYGDRVPDKYLQSAQKVEDAVSVVGQEAEVKQQNRTYINNLDNQRRTERDRLAREQKLQQQTEGPAGRTLTREECRDKYSARALTRERTECLRRAAGQDPQK